MCYEVRKVNRSIDHIPNSRIFTGRKVFYIEYHNSQIENNFLPLPSSTMGETKNAR